MTTENKFTARYNIDVSEHMEKKGQFNYLSWVHAVKTLQEQDPKATWGFKDSQVFPDQTMMIYVAVNAFDTSHTAFLPVTDYNNAPIKNPNAFQINTAMQRCLTKAIALHGIGLYIYAGEDLPPDVVKPNERPTMDPASYQLLMLEIKEAKSLPELIDAKNKRLSLEQKMNEIQYNALITATNDKAKEFKQATAITSQDVGKPLEETRGKA